MTYFICFRCQLLKETDVINDVKISKEATVFYCNDCVAKHLNSREVKE